MKNYLFNSIKNHSKRNIDNFTKTPYFKPIFDISKYTNTNEQQQLLTVFNFQLSQINQQEFEQIAVLL